VSTINLTAENIKGVHTEIVNLTAYGNVTTNITVLSTTANIVFNDTYNSKIIHLDSTSSPLITATFPNTISNGFNVSLVNAGTGTIFISAQGGLNAPGTINAIPYTAMFVYKVNNQFFGIGAFE
jgi:di/tripeptidase